MPMSTFRKIYGSGIQAALDPPHRPVDYSDDHAVMAVASRTRQSWLLLSEIAGGDPAFEDPMDGFRAMMTAVNSASDERLEEMKNLDRSMLHTPLRDAVYSLWNHVFWDVSQFLAEVGRTGTFEIPSHQVLGVQYPKQKPEGEMIKVSEMDLDCNILLGAVFLETGVKIRVLLGEDDQEALKEEDMDFDNKPEVLFDATETTDTRLIPETFNKPEVHWIRRGQKIQFFIGGDLEKPESDLAAVFVYGKYQPEEILCNSGDKETEEES